MLSRLHLRSILLGLLTTSGVVVAGPCDLYAAGGTPCVAAHSSTRALYQNYAGPLYQVLRADGAQIDIRPRWRGGVADSHSQDQFCAQTTCLISTLYDQSGHGNHLGQAPAGAFHGPMNNNADEMASAIGAPVLLNGLKAYGVFVPPGTGYRNNAANGTATGDAAQGIYGVLDGTHYNGACCFDYGNAEVDSHDTGRGHMEAVYFGDLVNPGAGSGKGPWIMADLEDGLWSSASTGSNAANPSMNSRFVTAVVKGEPNNWAIRGSDATSQSLSTFYSGGRPNRPGYNPMHKEGAIILGIGGDNSNSGQGTFYEGAMTAGYPSDLTENAVQADIAQAQYAAASLTSGPELRVGTSVSMRATSSCCTTRYISHSGNTINTQVVTDSSSASAKRAASWMVRPGLGNDACVSLESVDNPGNFMHQNNYQLTLARNDGSKDFAEDATFCPQAALNGQGHSLRSWNRPTRYVRHYSAILYAASNGGMEVFDNKNIFTDDASWSITAGFV